MSNPDIKIPSDDFVFRRVHRTDIVEGTLRQSAFRLKEKEDSLSVDWSDRSNPTKSYNRIAEEKRKFNGLVSLNVGEIRSIKSTLGILDVVHQIDPEHPDNDAHAGIHGLPRRPKAAKEEPRKELLKKIHKWEIDLLICELVMVLNLRNVNCEIESQKGCLNIAFDKDITDSVRIKTLLEQHDTATIIYNGSTSIVTNGEIKITSKSIRVENCENNPKEGLRLQSAPKLIHTNWNAKLEKGDFSIEFFKIMKAPFNWSEPQEEFIDFT